MKNLWYGEKTCFLCTHLVHAGQLHVVEDRHEKIDGEGDETDEDQCVREDHDPVPVNLRRITWIQEQSQFKSQFNLKSQFRHCSLKNRNRKMREVIRQINKL